MAVVRKRLTADQYEQMAAHGDLMEDDRVELIEGGIIAMSPVGSRHFECVTTLLELIIARKPDTVRVTMQNPIRLLDESEPEPDLTIMRAKRYWRRIPTVSDVRVIIEVSDSTCNDDHRTKMPLYSACGHPGIVDRGSDDRSRGAVYRAGHGRLSAGRSLRAGWRHRVRSGTGIGSPD